MAITHRGSELSLCWYCKNTNRFKCSWFNPTDPQPVPGWTATPKKVVGISGTTYHVKACPNFDPLDSPQEESDKVAGVSLKRDGYWQARINWKGQPYYLGAYKNKEAAIAARKAAEESIKRGEAPCRNNRR